MIAFIERGIRIPMGTVTRDYLRVHRLVPTQCAPNMFRILDSVDALNEKMGLNLTHNNVNQVYNLPHLKGQRYYLKTRYPKVRLISCLPESNKGMKKDFLIVSGEWHDDLPCPTREGTPGGVFRSRFITSRRKCTFSPQVFHVFLFWSLSFFLPLLVPKTINAPHFSPYCQPTNGRC